MTLKKSRMLEALYLLTLMVILLSGCVTSTPADNSFCLIYEPVYTSVKDTEDTKLQVDTNNLAFECLCEGNMKLCKKAGI